MGKDEGYDSSGSLVLSNLNEISTYLLSCFFTYVGELFTIFDIGPIE